MKLRLTLPNFIMLPVISHLPEIYSSPIIHRGTDYLMGQQTAWDDSQLAEGQR
jgi:hypothetical protein